MTESSLALIRLLQLFDSQLPVGAFAHSGGIETYAALGGGVAELRQVLEAQIELGWGRSELGAAHLAWVAADLRPEGGSHKLGILARRLDAMKVVPAVRDTSVKIGRRTLDLLRRLYPGIEMDVDPPHQAVVVGAVARRLGVPARELLLAFANNLATGTIAAALRCMRISPVQGQQLLVAAQPSIAAAVERAIDDPEGVMFTCTPALDIRSHQQGQLHTRLFQS
jgi:urease accessory protein